MGHGPAVLTDTATRPVRRPARGARLLVFALLAATAVAHSQPPAACPSHGVAVRILGSGGPELHDARASSGYLILRDGHAAVLLDAGGGTALRFGQAGATVTDLKAILISHLHADHTSDLPALVKSSYFEDRTATLPLYGPAGNARFPATTRFVQLLFGPHGAYRYLADYVSAHPADGYRLDAHDVAPAEGALQRLYDAQGIQIWAARVGHGSVPALAYRVDIDGHRIAYTGDTNGDTPALAALAAHADLLIAHNAVPEGAQGVERALHMPPSVIGALAHDAGVRELVLSHRMLRTLGQEAQTTQAIRRAYGGPLHFAEDLDCYALP